MYSSISRVCVVVSSSCPTTLPASSTAICATCVRSSWNTRSRSARISSWARGHDRLRLLLGARLQVGAQLVGRLAGLLDDPVRLLGALASCALYWLSSSSASCVRLLGLLHLALDLLPALLEQRVHAREHPLPHEEEDDRERDGADDQLGGVRIEVLLVRRLVDLSPPERGPRRSVSALVRSPLL